MALELPESIVQGRPHDLLWIPADVLESAPDWVRGALAQAPVVVVRRARIEGGRIPVGVRGPSRAERFAAFVGPECVLERVRPDELLSRPRLRDLPALRALDRIAEAWRHLELPWGPTGSTGFELATGVPALTASSDLDLVIDTRSPLSRREAQALLAVADRQDLPVDVRLETPLGSVALREFATHSNQVLMKTNDGPRLVLDPWHPLEGVCVFVPVPNVRQGRILRERRIRRNLLYDPL
jgi:phosphoribosyl-dephospho-CoA transferase